MATDSIPSKDSQTQEEVPAAVPWDEQEEKRLVRKIDARCLPALVILFILNFIVRGNLSNARLKGLQTDLSLTDTQYASALSILFAGYITMQVPSNLIMHAIPKPRLFMSGVVVIWGMISALTSQCHTFSSIAVCRFFLGFVEAAFYPASVYYLSRWYTRKEVGFRIACLNAGNMLAQGLGGLLAAGILSGLEGARGIRGWRWLFIIEGSITVAFGLMLPFVLADYPTTTTWLTPREREIAEGRLVHDVGLVDDPQVTDFQDGKTKGIFHDVKIAAGDVKVWALAFMYFTYIMGLSFGQYLPTITATLGFSTTITLLMTFPPWAFATIYALLNSWHSDRTGEKFWHIATSYGFALLGYIVALSAKTVAGKYISLFGMCMGFSGGIILLGWISSSIPRPPGKRAAAIALVNGFANIGQIPTSYLWPTTWSPKYWQSFVTEICLMVLSLAIGLGYRQCLIHLNGKLQRGEIEPFETNEKAVERSADLVHASVVEEKKMVHSFQYLY
ncbi:MFS general substrate transporter [Stereum hirsutum FP-91666 SS1]|uniref:MFS general substrate transporter n=1 Tax=Stereum hirsutum (strain FP-91666) TaxID=721885 RepID=UPI000444A74E|nr:MFS general substrate transporter [Stereum hirsutum FP-91666 SS1]EIM85213.1 MFS general substrate transporter [Stereum hirsutum FP-91666 SS1]